MTGETDPGPLAGFAVAVTTARRHRELAEALSQRGAAVTMTPLRRLVPVTGEPALLDAIGRCLVEPPDIVVVTTAGGWRRWLAAADERQLRDRMLRAFTDATVIARGRVAAAAVRDSGVPLAWWATSETLSELADHARSLDLAGRRVVVQAHGGGLDDLVLELIRRGADVIRVVTERWAPPAADGSVRRLAAMLSRGELHAVTFGHADSLRTLLDATARVGGRPALLSAFVSGVVAVCVDAATATPLTGFGVPAVWPDEPTVAAMVDLLGRQLPRAHARRVPVDGPPVLLRGHAVLVDGAFVALPPELAAVLHRLAERYPEAVPRVELAGLAWPHRPVAGRTLDRRIERLRAALGPHAGLIQRDRGRGYRLTPDVR